MDSKKILRPNPNVEEDLAHATKMDSAMLSRVKAYATVKRKSVKFCHCEDTRSSGVAPLLKLNDGRSVPSFGLGTWLGFSSQGGRVEPTGHEVEDAVIWAIDAGYRHIDTAHIYDTETQVGRAIKKKISDGTVKREDLFVTTKLWNDKHAPEAVLPALRASLLKLDLEYVDLYLIHWPVAIFPNGSLDNSIDYVDTWRAMQEARAQGLTRSIGVSNFNEGMLRRLAASSPVVPAMLQVEVCTSRTLRSPHSRGCHAWTASGPLGDSPLFAAIVTTRKFVEHVRSTRCQRGVHPWTTCRRVDAESRGGAGRLNLNLQQPSLLAYCRQQNIKVTAYTPFGSLFPSKAAPHAPPPRVDDPALVAMATKYNKTVPQVALRYLLDLGVIPIPKSVTQSRVQQNIQLFDFSLTPEEKQTLQKFDRGYRTIDVLHWKDSPYYPFEKPV
ncbi:hypothetical protein MSG28_015242 [Choristoneura fumiferana]|uniref:Uncharacterized protein n=1 Tax=Choristoneura fumiferana TaxID=7141 RepID=A0ACC0KZL1_CHOFU|nr:hypothetical protein MSG28_015242 [Choristoneura fumiferana]